MQDELYCKPSLPSICSLSPLSLHPPSHVGSQDGWQIKVGCPLHPTPLVTLVFLFPGPVYKLEAFLKQHSAFVLALNPHHCGQGLGEGRTGVALTKPDPVTDLASPVLLMGKLTTRASASLALLGHVPRGQCALAAGL